jgi:hypothetical protein
VDLPLALNYIELIATPLVWGIACRCRLVSDVQGGKIMFGNKVRIGRGFCRDGKAAMLIRTAVAVLAVSLLMHATSLHFGQGSSIAAGSKAPALITYPNQVVRTDKPGQIGLWIEGEDWQLRVDMPGFVHVEWPFTSPSQFLFMTNPGSETTASIFAERIAGADSEESCRRHYAATSGQVREGAARSLGEGGTAGPVSEVEMNGKLLLVFEFGSDRLPLRDYRRKSLHWFPYYRGFCFDFHFDASSPSAEKEVLRILNSVAYLAQKPTNTDVERLFYLYHFRIRLNVPIDWSYSFRPPPDGPLGGIELRQPEKGEAFSFLISPLGTANSTKDQTGAMTVAARQAKLGRGDAVSHTRSKCSVETCVKYYDVTIRGDEPQYSKDFATYGIRYHRHGFVRLGDSIVGVSLLYSDGGTAAAEHLTENITQAKVLDLKEFRNKIERGDAKELMKKMPR